MEMLPIEIPRLENIEEIDIQNVDAEKIRKYVGKYVTRKVLVIGNGFDLAHDLLTSYDDFLLIMKDPDEFFRYYEHDVCHKAISGVYDANNVWKRHLEATNQGCEEYIQKMVEILRNNSWAYYYANCNAEINGWIDFEREINPVIEMFNDIISNGSQHVGSGNKDYAIVRIEDIGKNRIAKLWPKYIKAVNSFKDINQGIGITVESEYSDKQYGVIAGKLVKDLKSDLDEFVEAFRLYLDAFVENRHDIEPKSLFESMDVSDIINFNYTNTAYYYHMSLRNATRHFVHGSTLNKDSEKMVFGVNSVDRDAEYRFKEFEKRYQRLCNNIKQSYYRIIDEGNYELFFYGHSMDISDKSILEPLIRGAKRSTIYCYTDGDGYSNHNKIINNLMMLLSDDDADAMLRNDKIVLK